VQGDKTSLVRGDTGLAVVCCLLGVEESQLRTWLCSPKVVTTRETFTKPKNAEAKDHFLLAKSVQWRS
jgi:myosin heavy subunit